MFVDQINLYSLKKLIFVIVVNHLNYISGVPRGAKEAAFTPK